MAGDAMDYYDVERMVEDAAGPLRARIEDLREELRRERVERQDADESVLRVLNARTEHLA